MPTFNEQNVLFGATWDNTGFVEGINEQVTGFKKLEAEQKVAQVSFEKTTQQAKELELEIRKVTEANVESAQAQKVTNKLTDAQQKELTDLLATQKYWDAQNKKTAVSVTQLDTAKKKLVVTTKQVAAVVPTATTAMVKLQATTVATTAATGGLSKSFNSAFGSLKTLANIIPGLGISGIFLLAYEGLTVLLEGLDLFSSKLTEVEERQTLFNDVMKEANEDAGKQVATVKVLTQAAQDETLAIDERLKAVRILQKEFPAYFGNLTQEAILTGDITAETNALTAAIQASARARAAKGQIDKIEAQRLDIEFEKEKIRNATRNETIAAREKGTNVVTATDEFGNAVGVLTPADQIKIILARREAALQDQEDKDAALKRQGEFLTKFVGLGNIVDTLDKPGKVATTVKNTEDAYKKALQNAFDLQKLLLEDEIKTQQAIAASNILYTERAAAAQRAADLENDLAFLTFEYQQKLGKDELLNEAQNAIAIKNINIKLNQDLQKIFADRAKFASTEAIAAPAEDRSAELQAAARQRVEDSINNQIRAAGADRQNIIAANESLEIQALNEKRSKGLVSERQYRKQLKEIQERSQKEALEAVIQNLERQLKELDKFANSNEFNAINAKLQEKKAELTKIDLSAGEKITKFLDDVSIIENAIVGLYQSINEAEQESLNRSIALQQQRVNNARFIAERGNAEYLALEQKRLDELVRRQEAAAQKQIAIANAVAVAQALVAIIKSIAEAPPGIGFILAAQTIALIAAGYKFVSSLQPVSTSFYEGTPYVERGKHKAGKDTIPARVNIGEAIIPTDTNAKYKDSVMAIYNKTIPPNVLNDFVNSYPHNRVPTTDFTRLGTATDYKMSEVTETNKKLDKVYEVLTSIDAGLLGASPVDIRMDRDGFYVGWHEYVKKQKIRRKA